MDLTYILLLGSRYDDHAAAEAGASSGSIDAGWLKKEVEKTFSPTTMGMSIMDMCSTIFDLLCSPKSDSALQNDVSVEYDKKQPKGRRQNSTAAVTDSPLKLMTVQ